MLLQISILLLSVVLQAGPLGGWLGFFTRLVHPLFAIHDFLEHTDHLPTDQNKLKLTRMKVQLSKAMRLML